MAAGDNITLNENVNISGDLRVTGTLSALPTASLDQTHLTSTTAIPRTKLAQDNVQGFSIPLHSWRTWDAPTTSLPSAAANDDLGLVYGTFGTAHDLIQTGDCKNTTTTRHARAMATLPYNYQAAETVMIRAYAGMETTVASSSTTIDFDVRECTGHGGYSSDICTTSPTSINSLTYGNKDFVITATDLVAGDLLDIKMTMIVTDSGTGTAVIGSVGKLFLLVDLRG